ncbi:hypothetical protein BVRB_5g126320 [Beta vulgaris subsp. vulgaris]|uniref:Uncharacterized protein n=1 Tax=Beta vulgaris subsp. vulgaris TaxID=3555 RepID=A0A0J8B8E5_BETVV|nr:hypothetical protein BVRB_5g126320 [Beta vulgaris subsp. vulgaris]
MSMWFLPKVYVHDECTNPVRSLTKESQLIGTFDPLHVLNKVVQLGGKRPLDNGCSIAKNRKSMKVFSTVPLESTYIPKGKVDNLHCSGSNGGSISQGNECVNQKIVLGNIEAGYEESRSSTFPRTESTMLGFTNKRKKCYTLHLSSSTYSKVI